MLVLNGGIRGCKDVSVVRHVGICALFFELFGVFVTIIIINIVFIGG